MIGTHTPPAVLGSTYVPITVSRARYTAPPPPSPAGILSHLSRCFFLTGVLLFHREWFTLSRRWNFNVASATYSDNLATLEGIGNALVISVDKCLFVFFRHFKATTIRHYTKMIDSKLCAIRKRRMTHCYRYSH